jgi:hypothetical protein
VTSRPQRPRGSRLSPGTSQVPRSPGRQRLSGRPRSERCSAVGCNPQSVRRCGAHDPRALQGGGGGRLASREVWSPKVYGAFSRRHSARAFAG